ncbi:hypothetical protein [Pandoraea eparura]|uniref:hypothetical protein n=1 Tax=Pandoraea eparura TaxID=2508291 RepID=UPI0012424DB9|nr:hypothetical protein [Pandoraea eparura]
MPTPENKKPARLEIWRVETVGHVATGGRRIRRRSIEFVASWASSQPGRTSWMPIHIDQSASQTPRRRRLAVVEGSRRWSKVVEGGKWQAMAQGQITP